MKRDGFNDDGPANKRQRNSDDEVTFLIPSKVAGSIIGKGGSNISKLRSEFKASITVPDCPGPERVLTITSPEIDTTLDVVKEILPSLSEGGPKGGGNEELDVRMLIHQSRAGCVIGKGGAKIKELREKTGARLKIFSNTAPQSTDRVVQLIGDVDAVVAGVREVLELTRQTPIKGGISHYDPHNYDDFYADEYGGFGRARRPPPPHMPPPGRGVGPRGPGGPGGAGGARGPRPPFEFGARFPPPPRAFAPAPRRPPPPRAAHPPHQPHQPHQSHQSHQPTTTQVTIPKDLAGAIIGKAGSRIRKIRMESGASIEIAEPLAGANERVITISGDPPAIQMAQYLLQQSVHESNPNLARGGGGGGGNF